MPNAMTLLGELYANGFGVARDDNKAAEWYRLAAERGDRDAMFALAMFNIGGRAGAVDRDEAAQLLADGGQARPRRRRLRPRPALSRRPAVPAGFRPRRRTVPHRRRRPAIRKRNTRWRRSTRRAAASPRTPPRPRACWRRPRLPTTSTPRSNTRIALFNGTGVAKDEAAAAALLQQGRAARAARSRRTASRTFWRSGRGLQADPVAGHQMAPDRQGRRRQRHSARRVHAQKQKPEVRTAGREGGAALARGDQGIALLTPPGAAGRPAFSPVRLAPAGIQPAPPCGRRRLNRPPARTMTSTGCLKCSAPPCSTS